MRFRKKGLAALAVAAGTIGAAPPGQIDLTVDGLRSTKGNVLVCVTEARQTFPKCDRDPRARRFVLPSAQARQLQVRGLPSGQYAVALIHDENANNRLDTALAMPREGFGFSRNPAVTFGPPPFAKAEFHVAGEVAQTIRVKYFL